MTETELSNGLWLLTCRAYKMKLNYKMDNEISMTSFEIRAYHTSAEELAKRKDKETIDTINYFEIFQYM